MKQNIISIRLNKKNKTVKVVTTIKKKDINNYVCRECFNKIGKCTCDEYPLYLIHMDKDIQEHIKILNEKNYRTKFCCASHDKSLYIHIVFCFNYFEDYNQEQLPSNFKYDKKNFKLYCDLKCNNMSIEEIKNKRTLALNDLLDFCKNLEQRSIYKI